MMTIAPTMLALLLAASAAASAAAAVSEATADGGATVTATPEQQRLRLLREGFDARLESMGRIRALIEGELLDGGMASSSSDGASSDGASSLGGAAASLDQMYDDMELLGSKVAELIRRTEGLLGRMGEHNRMALSVEKEEGRGLESRLGAALSSEMGRRDRYNASLVAAAIEENATAAIAAEEDEKETAASSDYISRSELNALLSRYKVLDPTEYKLYGALSTHAVKEMEGIVKRDDEFWRERASEVPAMYEQEFEEFEELLGELSSSSGGDDTDDMGCLDVPRATGIVGKALGERLLDGTGLFDHASRENGGSVVYELTSAAHVPPPRMDGDAAIGGGGNERARRYEREKRRAFDKQTEAMYRQQQAVVRVGVDSQTSFLDSILEVMDDVNPGEWYESFEFENLRPHLPDDWERALDSLSEKAMGGEGGRSWSEHTPRGAIDALVPDYVYHSLGLEGFGRTVGPEVAITAGAGGDGGDARGGGGWTARPMGSCYPISMRPEDDPVPSLLRRGHGGGGSSLPVGPKYTVRLPYPVRVDAITLEHRSFPVAPRELSEGGNLGGESAPRWVRAVGYPPCGPDEGDEECGTRGFDIDRPIDLGAFKYRRITVTGREDDYGGGNEDNDDEEEEGAGEDGPFPAGRRRRSVQTFPARGGRWRPKSLLENGSGRGSSVDAVEISRAGDPGQQCTFGEMSCGDPPPLDEPEEEEHAMAGQCAPPEDDDSPPSCGEGEASSASPSYPLKGGGGDNNGVDERHVVEAVSFVVEENWGNAEYTCLYRVRVHGDVVVMGE